MAWYLTGDHDPLVSPLGKSRRRAVQRGPNRKRSKWPLDMTILDWTQRGEDLLALRAAVEGIGVMGAPGSSKTRGVGQAVTQALLSAGCSGMGTLTKEDDLAFLQRLAKRTDRDRDLIVVEPGGHSYNVLENVRNSQEGGHLLAALMALVDRNEVGQGASTEAIWQSATQMFQMNTLDFLKLGGWDWNLRNLGRVIATVPRERHEIEEAKKLATEALKGKHPGRPLTAFQELFCDVARNVETGRSPLDRFTQERVESFWLHELVSWPEKTVGSVLFTAATLMDHLLRGETAEMLSTKTTFSLEEVLEEGKIVVVNRPLKLFPKVGAIAQNAIKHLFLTRAEERSIDPEDARTRPAFLIQDECHGTVTPQEIEAHATLRSARVCSLMMTQSIGSLRRALGADGFEALSAVWGTKVCHAVDPGGETAKWFCDLIGQDWRRHRTTNIGGDDVSFSFTEQLKNELEPKGLGKLARGGPLSGYRAEAYVFKPGSGWGRGRDFVKARFDQRTGETV